jgi:transglutaminase-like putative cysteine protease
MPLASATSSNKKKYIPAISWYERDLLTPHCVRKALWGVVLDNTGNPLLVDLAAWIIKKYNVPERNELALARAVQRFAQDYIKYFREKPERFASPIRTLVWKIGDCDDKTILVASILRSFKIPVRLKMITYRHFSKKEGKERDFCHVYPQAKIDGKIYAIESVHKWPLGLDAENLVKAKKIPVETHVMGDF